MSADPAPELAQLAPTPRLLDVALTVWHNHRQAGVAVVTDGTRMRCRCGWTATSRLLAGPTPDALQTQHDRHRMAAVLVVVLADG